MTEQQKGKVVATTVAPAVHKKIAAKAKELGLPLKEFVRQTLEIAVGARESVVEAEERPKKPAKKATKAKKAPAKPKPKMDPPVVEDIAGFAVASAEKVADTLGIARTDDDSARMKTPCTHPRGTLKRLSYGTYCGVCNQKVR